MSQSRRRAALLSTFILTLVEKKNSNNRMTLKFVEYLYFSSLERGFAQPRRKIASLLSLDATFCD